MGSLHRANWVGKRPPILAKLALDMDYNIFDEFRGDPISEFASTACDEIRRRLFQQIYYIQIFTLAKWVVKSPPIQLNLALDIEIDI